MAGGLSRNPAKPLVVRIPKVGGRPPVTKTGRPSPLKQPNKK